MAQPNVLLDDIGKVTTPSYTLPTARIFVFAATETEPAFISIYTAENGKPILRDSQPLASYTRSRYSRRQPHIALTESGEEWQILKAGCGCGSPIRRVSIRQAYLDHSKQEVGG